MSTLLLGFALESQAGGFVNVTKKMVMESVKNTSSVPVWLVVLVGGLVLLFTVLLILSPVGSNKRRGKRRTIFK